MHPSSRQSAPPGRAGLPPPRWTLIALLVAVAATSPLGVNIYLPSMPGMTADFHTDFATIQLTLSVYLVAVAAGQLVVGSLSDHLGRRPVLLAGLGLFVVGTLVCLLAPDIGTLLAGRVIQAVGGCAGLTLSRAVVRDLYGQDQAASVLGYVTMGIAVAPMAAPSLGGALDALYGWRANFMFLLVFGGITLVLAMTLLGETRPGRGGGGAVAQMLRAYARLTTSRPFWGYSLTVASTTGVFFCFVAGGSFVTIELMGRSPLEYGAWFAMVPGGYILGNFLSARLAARAGARRLIMSGTALILAGVAAMAAAVALGLGHPLGLFLPMFFVGIGNGLVIPSGVAGAISVRPEMAGSAAGLSGSLQMGAGALTAPLVGALLDTSAWPMIGIMAICALLGLFSFLLVERSRPT